jgi:hypothetical protein
MARWPKRSDRIDQEECEGKCHMPWKQDNELVLSGYVFSASVGDKK